MRIRAAIGKLLGPAAKSRAALSWMIAALLLLALNWLVFFWKLLPLAASGAPIPIHYSVKLGIDKFLPWWWTLAPPLAASGALLLNGLIGSRLWQMGRGELSLLVGFFTVFLLGLFLAGTILTVLLNVSV